MRGRARSDEFTLDTWGVSHAPSTSITSSDAFSVGDSLLYAVSASDGAQDSSADTADCSGDDGTSAGAALASAVISADFSAPGSSIRSGDMRQNV